MKELQERIKKDGNAINEDILKVDSFINHQVDPELMAHIGEEFEGIISGVTEWGFYVELPNTVEGLVHVVDLRDDHYNFIEQTYEMVGEHTGKTYKLGEKVRVRVSDADKLLRTINFELV